METALANFLLDDGAINKLLEENDISVTKFLNQRSNDTTVTKFLDAPPSSDNEISVTKFLDGPNDISVTKFMDNEQNFL